MALEEYRRKRKLAKTPEPAGSTQPPHYGRIFVVQKHAAKRLHYDFRLAIEGVLVSWAVPRGPSMNPAERRLAIRTEDHPLEYADFEGVIPQGQYGAGTAMVWDRGEYEAKGCVSLEEQFSHGKIDVNLRGKKLQGGFTLIRTRPRSPDRGEGERWLVIKHRDEHADPSWDVESPELDYSVLTGRTLKEIEEATSQRVATVVCPSP
jgi:bifunctional non-homologous end joining protein LigD